MKGEVIYRAPEGGGVCPSCEAVMEVYFTFKPGTTHKSIKQFEIDNTIHMKAIGEVARCRNCGYSERRG